MTADLDTLATKWSKTFAASHKKTAAASFRAGWNARADEGCSYCGGKLTGDGRCPDCNGEGPDLYLPLKMTEAQRRVMLLAAEALDREAATTFTHDGTEHQFGDIADDLRSIAAPKRTARYSVRRRVRRNRPSPPTESSSKPPGGDTT